jgi:hypothetical protein
MPRIKSLDLSPEGHRTYLRRFITSWKRDDPVGGRNYELFIERMLDLFTDNPPVSWRFVVTTYRYPTFRVFNKKTGKLNDFVRVHELGIVIASKFFDEEFRSLFPIMKGFYGTGDEVRIEYAKFGRRLRDQYLSAIENMIRNHSDISINFPAHS